MKAVVARFAVCPLLRHVRDVHKVAPEVNTRVKCDVCGVDLSSLEEYLRHHITTHKFVAEYVQRTFLNDKGYQFELTTLLVLDEVGSGVPIAYFICEKMKEESLAAFFRSLEFAISKKAEAKTFMSDDASQFYKARSSVLGAPQQKLHCAWHLDRNWQKKIHECIEKQMRLDVYHNVRHLLEFLDQQEFKEYIQSFLDIKEAKLRDFMKYFKDNYAVRPQEWAY
ncbi:hypothetical protein MRX96_020863 [Rhipicephalus microplus]